MLCARCFRPLAAGEAVCAGCGSPAAGGPVSDAGAGHGPGGDLGGWAPPEAQPPSFGGSGSSWPPPASSGPFAPPGYGSPPGYGPPPGHGPPPGYGPPFGYGPPPPGAVFPPGYPGYRPPDPGAAARNRTAIIAVAVVVVLLLVVFALLASQSPSPPTAQSRSAGGGVVVPAAPERPTTQDHWHNPYAIVRCGKIPSVELSDRRNKRSLNTEGDGIIHIQPLTSAEGGRHATLGAFLEQIDVELTPTSIAMYGSPVVSCDGRPARVRVYRWQLDQPPGPPEVFTSGFESIRLDHNHDAYTISLSSDDSVPDLPTSIHYLDHLGDAPRYPRPRPAPSNPNPSLEDLTSDMRSGQGIGTPIDLGSHLDAKAVSSMLADPSLEQLLLDMGLVDAFHMSWRQDDIGVTYELALVELPSEVHVESLLGRVQRTSSLGSVADAKLRGALGYRLEGPGSVQLTILAPTLRYLIVSTVTAPTNALPPQVSGGVDAAGPLASLQQAEIQCAFELRPRC